MKYTKKDLITRFLKTYWIFCIAVLFLIYGFVLISFCPSSSVWYPIGMALVGFLLIIFGAKEVNYGCFKN